MLCELTLGKSTKSLPRKAWCQSLSNDIFDVISVVEEKGKQHNPLNPQIMSELKHQLSAQETSQKSNLAQGLKPSVTLME